jgi:vitamin B12/bleomycin/antimicrobial peptide transport system ATP-binding/permease protein
VLRLEEILEITLFAGLMSVKIHRGNDALGEVVQVAAAFVVQGAFNWMTDSYGRISECAASANRVASLLLALDQIDGQTSPSAVAGADCNESQIPQEG